VKSSLHCLIHFLLLFCNCQLNSIPLLPSSYPDKLTSRNSTRLRLLKWSLLYNHFVRTTKKTQPLYRWEGVFTAPLHGNRSYSIVACVFIGPGMWLPSRCLAMNIYSEFTIPAFGRHITIYRHKISTTLILNRAYTPWPHSHTSITWYFKLIYFFAYSHIYTSMLLCLTIR
jgi:hypothetical protein